MATHLQTPRLGYNRRWLLTEAQPLTVCGRPARHCQIAKDGVLPTCKTWPLPGGDIVRDIELVSEAMLRPVRLRAVVSLPVARVLLLGRALTEPWPFIVMRASEIHCAMVWGLTT